MEDRLNRAPCGFLVFNENWEIVEINDALKKSLRMEEAPKRFLDLLTTPSKIYFQTYFTPAMSIHGKVREMYVNIKAEPVNIPVVMNVNEHDGLYESILVQINERDEYENQLLRAKKQAVQIQQETDQAYHKLRDLLKEVEEKQQLLLQLNDQLHDMATLDELTGLYNRRMFQWQFTGALEKDDPFSLAILDIDHFKKVNDTYGHQTGDLVLRELAEKLQMQMIPPHIAARVGGEEFAVIFHCDEAKAKEAANQLFTALSAVEWKHIPITVSIGLSPRQQGDNFSSIYERADKALYESKRNGRNRLTSI